MQFNILAPFQAFLRPKNQFALFFVASFVAKLLHLGSHALSLPILLYVLYFPTFILPDVALLVGSKVFLYTQNGGHTSTTRKAVGGLLAIFTLSCSAAQVSFFVETGGEIQWMAAGRVLGGSGGLGLLLSGLPSMSIAAVVLYSIAWIITPRLYDSVEHALEQVLLSFRRSYTILIKKEPQSPEDQVPLMTLDEEQASSAGTQESVVQSPRPTKPSPNSITSFTISIATLTTAIVVGVLQTVRPAHPPYAHMSGSLPITLIEAALFQPINSEFCLAHPVQVAIFPFEQFNHFFNRSRALDWMPQSASCSRANGPEPPPWLEHPGGDGISGRSPNRPLTRSRDLQSEEAIHRNIFSKSLTREALAHGPPHDRPPHGPPHDDPLHHGPPQSGDPHHGPPEHGSPDEDDFRNGFHPKHRGHGYQGGYEPVCDPLRLSNLNASILPSLSEGLGNKRPKIKNILLLTLESTRQDVFPLKKNSHAYNTILSSYGSSNTSAGLDKKLASLSQTAAFLTGETTGFEGLHDGVPKKDWMASFDEGMGGISVDGAISQAAYTLKSLLSSHCGVEPLPVDFAEETNGQIYQACLPQILRSMTSVTPASSGNQETKVPKSEGNKDYRTWDWTSAMIQSVTDQFDSQDLLDEQMGFTTVIAENTISNPSAKYFPPKEPWVNYFGYPESETLDYLRDLFTDGQKHQNRVFVSHLTSSPHHPFLTPKDWAGETAYFNKQRWLPEDPFDNYLNTIKYQDDWISQIFEMLHEVGALQETLVVLTGDHGLAFKSLDHSQSAVNNGHVSNFRIPLLFVHPDLPRIQVSASTTPLSILPTVLDLLSQAGSLAPEAEEMAATLLPRYEGKSLIRDLDYSVLTGDGTSKEAFFQPFHFSAINPGGSLLAISDAFTPFRLILPLCSAIPLRFTDVSVDPYELEPLTAWTMDELVAIVKVKRGERAKDWVKLAEELGRWWVWNQRDKWGYWGEARSMSRGGGAMGGSRGRVKLKHWWETK